MAIDPDAEIAKLESRIDSLNKRLIVSEENERVTWKGLKEEHGCKTDSALASLIEEIQEKVRKLEIKFVKSKQEYIDERNAMGGGGNKETE